MKIILELEIGPETGVVCDSLEKMIKMLEEAEKITGKCHPLLDVARGILEKIEGTVSMFNSQNYGNQNR